jgi:hypothetical protein
MSLGNHLGTKTVLGGAATMPDINKFSEQMIDVAERLADVADAAKGKGIRRGSMGTRWLLLPAAGAGIYALATNGTLAKRAKGVVDGAKTRAADLPEDLINRVRRASTTSRSRTQNRRRTTSARKSSSVRKSTTAPKTSSAR